MATTQVTAYDEKGNPVAPSVASSSSDQVTAYDEKGNPITPSQGTAQVGEKTIVTPVEGESFASTMARGVKLGRGESPAIPEAQPAIKSAPRNPLSEIENYTQEGRAEHPILSRVGDVTRGIRDWTNIAGTEAGILFGGPEMAEEAAVSAPARVPVWKGVSEAVPVAGRAEEAPVIGKNWSGRSMVPKPSAAVAGPVQTAEAPTAVAGPSTSKQVETLTNQVFGGGSVTKPGVTLGERAKELIGRPAAGPPVEITPVAGKVPTLEEKFPNTATRQIAHVSGEDAARAVANDPAGIQALHHKNMENHDLRQALINSGDDMGQVTVSNAKLAGPGSITREQAFKRLFAKGYTWQDIVRLAKQAPK